MKAFKRLSAALKASNGNPILRVGDLYIVGDINELTSIDLMETNPEKGSATYSACVTCGHLDRLGNANWATAGKTNNKRIWKRL